MTKLSELLDMEYPDNELDLPMIEIQIGRMDQRGAELLDSLSSLTDNPNLSVGEAQDIVRSAQWWLRARYLEFVISLSSKDRVALDLLGYLDGVVSDGSLTERDKQAILDNAAWWLVLLASVYTCKTRGAK
jgi:hypothetical protein